MSAAPAEAIRTPATTQKVLASGRSQCPSCQTIPRGQQCPFERTSRGPQELTGGALAALDGEAFGSTRFGVERADADASGFAEATSGIAASVVASVVACGAASVEREAVCAVRNTGGVGGSATSRVRGGDAIEADTDGAGSGTAGTGSKSVPAAAPPTSASAPKRTRPLFADERAGDREPDGDGEGGDGGERDSAGTGVGFVPRDGSVGRLPRDGVD